MPCIDIIALVLVLSASIRTSLIAELQWTDGPELKRLSTTGASCVHRSSGPTSTFVKPLQMSTLARSISDEFNYFGGSAFHISCSMCSPIFTIAAILRGVPSRVVHRNTPSG